MSIEWRNGRPILPDDVNTRTQTFLISLHEEESLASFMGRLGEDFDCASVYAISPDNDDSEDGGDSMTWRDLGVVCVTFLTESFRNWLISKLNPTD